jgi:predicted RNase H-like HicB family nuclease
MKTYTYTVHIEPGDDHGYVVSVPALPGCFSQGETYDEAIEMAQDAIRCYLESLVKDGEPIPEESQPPARVAVGVRVNAVAVR